MMLEWGGVVLGMRVNLHTLRFRLNEPNRWTACGFLPAACMGCCPANCVLQCYGRARSV